MAPGAILGTVGAFIRSDFAFNLYLWFGAACSAHLMFTTDHYQAQAYFMYALIPLGVLGLAVRRRFLAMRSRIIALTAVYLALLIASSAISGDVGADWVFTVTHATKAADVLLRAVVISAFLVAFIAVLVDLSLTRPGMVTWSLMVLGILVAASALANMVIFQLDPPMDTPRLTATIGMPPFSGPTHISATYAIFAAGAIGVAASPPVPRTWRMAALPVAGVLSIGTFLTQSRSGIVAIVCAVLAMAAMTPWSRRVILPTLMVACVVVVAAAPEMAQSLVNRGFSDRPELWTLYTGLAVERPWTGYGGFADIDVTLADGRSIDQPHNLVFSALIRGGIPAAAMMLALLAGSLWWAFRYQRATLNAGPLGAIVALATAGMADYQLVITLPDWHWITFWFPIALCASAEMIVRSGARTRATAGNVQ